MKSILVIGMGKFGHHFVNELIADGNNEVMIIDKNESQIRDMFSLVTSARVGDCTNPDVLKSLGVKNFDIIVVCIGEDFQNSLEVTSIVKEMGAPYVISMASRDIHAKFLLKNGADEVVYPDRDIAVNLAAKCSSNNVFDYIAVSQEYSIYEISVLKEWSGKTIRAINVRAVHNVYIIAIVNHKDGLIVKDTDHIKVLGKKKDVNKLIN